MRKLYWYLVALGVAVLLCLALSVYTAFTVRQLKAQAPSAVTATSSQSITGQCEGVGACPAE